MGISRGALRLLTETVREDVRKGRVITFGVQSIQASESEARALLAAVGIAAADLPSSKHDAAQARRIHQERLFKLLGYEVVEGIDFYPDEKPTHVIDLNVPVPESMRAQYDLIYDGGTAEHCFAAAEVFCNALRLARPGGRIIHHLPMNNWVDHGFYQFSPTLFFDFYGANGCRDLSLWVHFSEKGAERCVRYRPGRDVDLPYSLGNKANVLAFFTAVKAQGNADIVFPIQGRYRRTFGAEAGATAAPTGHWARFKRSLIKRTVKWRARRL